MNPYWGQNFFGFFKILFLRLLGQIPCDHLPPDEIQLIVLVGVSISTVLLGVLLSLKKMTMMANSLSHTTLLGIVISYILFTCSTPSLDLHPGILLLAAFITAFLTTVLTELTRDYLKLQEDAAIGLIFTTLFALGMILVTIFTRSMHIGVEVITGNVDALHQQDIPFVWMTAIVNFVIIAIFFRSWILISFDENLSFSLGIPTRIYHYLLMLLTALSLISAFRAVGVILVLSLLVGPVLIARQWVHRPISLFFLSTVLGIVFSILGVAFSRHFLSVYHTPLSTGGLIVTFLAIGYLIASLLTLRSRRSLIKG